MSRARLPSAVTLPEVHQYTEDIMLGSLGSPLGFDQERVQVNLRSLDRARMVAGLGKIHVIAFEPSADVADVDIASIDPEGVASLRLVGSRPKESLAQSFIKYQQGKSGLFRVPDVVVRLNKTELEARIEDMNKNVYDPVIRAKFLNKSLRKGLAQASFSASFGLGDCLLSTTMYGLAAAEYGVPNTTWAYLGIGASVILGAMDVHSRIDDGDEMIQAIRDLRPSLFFGVTPDRYIAAAGLISFGKFIKAHK